MFNIYLTILIIQFSGLILPGPDFAIISRYSVINGFKTGMYCTLGVATGVAINLILTCLIGSLLYTKFMLFYVIFLLLGILFLYKLSFNLVFKTIFNKEKLISDNLSVKMPIGSAYKNGLLTNLSNIKAIMFFSSFLPFINKLSNLYIFLTLISIFFISILWFCFISYIFSHKYIKQFMNKQIMVFEVIVGIFMFIFASVIFYENIFKYFYRFLYHHI